MTIDIENTKGIARTLSQDGRITIPFVYRKELNIKNGENLEMFLCDGGILLRKENKDGE